MKSDQAQANLFMILDRGDRVQAGSSHRTYWHLTLLRDKLQRIISSDLLPPGETLLDYGCAEKPYEPMFGVKFKRYIGADIAGNTGADLIIGAEGCIPSDDESFDCVLSSQVLEHVLNPQVYLGEAHRVLKQGGSLILSTHGIWSYHPDPTDLWRWTIDGLQREICRAGFDIVMSQSVFGPEAVALQLWQDATYERLPRALRAPYTWFFQTLIGLIERRHPDKLSNDASVYIVLARKPNKGDAAVGSTELGERRDAR